MSTTASLSFVSVLFAGVLAGSSGPVTAASFSRTYGSDQHFTTGAYPFASGELLAAGSVDGDVDLIETDAGGVVIAAQSFASGVPDYHGLGSATVTIGAVSPDLIVVRGHELGPLGESVAYLAGFNRGGTPLWAGRFVHSQAGPDAFFGAGVGFSRSGTVLLAGSASLSYTYGWLAELDPDTGADLGSYSLGVGQQAHFRLDRVADTAAGGLIALGRTDRPWLVGLASDRTIRWEREFDYGLTSYGRDVLETDAGRFAVLIDGARDESWLLIIDSLGLVSRSRAYSGPVGFRVSSFAVTPEGGYLIGGWHGASAAEKVPVLIEVERFGEIIWGFDYPRHGCAVSKVWIGSDGSRRAAAPCGDSGLWLFSPELDGTLDIGCITSRPLSVTMVDEAPVVTDTSAGIQPVASSAVGMTVDGPFASDLEARSDCGLAVTGPIEGLRAVRDGGHVALSWEPDRYAMGYHAWKVRNKDEIDYAREGQPLAFEVLGCQPGAPVTDTECWDVDAIPTPELVFYQVRGVSEDWIEGP